MKRFTLNPRFGHMQEDPAGAYVLHAEAQRAVAAARADERQVAVLSIHESLTTILVTGLDIKAPGVDIDACHRRDGVAA